MKSIVNNFNQIFDQKPYTSVASQVITACEAHKSKQEETYYKIACLSTIFYPEGGGQVGDIGFLGDAEIFDTQRELLPNGESTIYHFAKSHLDVGSTVLAKIDWPRRFSLMQHHSAEHIISGLTHKKYGYENVGFALNTYGGTLDFDQSLSPRAVDEIFLEANSIVTKNLMINKLMFSEDKQVNLQLKYRSKMDIDGPLRLISIDDVDLCACSAPHVERTGEIGLIVSTKTERMRGGTRIHYLAGDKAYQYAKANIDQTARISHYFSLPFDQVMQGVENQESKIEALEKQVHEMKHLLWPIKSIDSQKYLMLLQNKIFNANDIKIRLKSYQAQNVDGLVFVLMPLEQKTQFFISEKQGDLMRYLREHFDLKGGGPPELSQGMINSNFQAIIAHFDNQEQFPFKFIQV